MCSAECTGGIETIFASKRLQSDMQAQRRPGIKHKRVKDLE